MTDLRFKALVLRQQDKQLSVSVEELGLQELPAGEVLVRVAYSSLNYKDAMALGNRGIIRNFPATLQVRMTERAPVARVLVQDGGYMDGRA